MKRTLMTALVSVSLLAGCGLVPGISLQSVQAERQVDDKVKVSTVVGNVGSQDKDEGEEFCVRATFHKGTETGEVLDTVEQCSKAALAMGKTVNLELVSNVALPKAEAAPTQIVVEVSKAVIADEPTARKVLAAP